MAFQWIPFLIFAAVNSFTPGPNVIMLASSGSAFGYRRTLPHVLGICFGFPLMLLVVQFGAHEVFARFPWMFPLLTALSLLYVLWLGVRIFRLGLTAAIEIKQDAARPMTFWEAALFQWVNGKAWQIILMAATLYATESYTVRMLQAFAFFVILIFAASIWVELGKRIARHLQKPKVRFAYYTLLSVSLLASTWPRGVETLLQYFQGH